MKVYIIAEVGSGMAVEVYANREDAEKRVAENNRFSTTLFYIVEKEVK